MQNTTLAYNHFCPARLAACGEMLCYPVPEYGSRWHVGLSIYMRRDFRGLVIFGDINRSDIEHIRRTSEVRLLRRRGYNRFRAGGKQTENQHHRSQNDFTHISLLLSTKQ